jgi:hypothetical protein
LSDAGKKITVPTPYNDKVIRIVKKIEAGELSPAFENLRFFDI